tara:strand:+ start:54 stop:521 length:468 start_codon:yes stop_codon:yes gene_type:complete
MTIYFGDSTTMASASGMANKVIQVVERRTTAKFATTNQTYTNVTDFYATITPTSSSNKVLFMSFANFGAGNTGHDNFARVTRNGTNIMPQDQSIRMPSAYLVSTFNNTILDSPNTTSAVTYRYQVRAAANEVFLNRGGSNTHRGYSSIILMELTP